MSVTTDNAAAANKFAVQPQPAPDMPVRALRLHEVQAIAPFTDMHLGRLEKAGKFPRRIRIGGRRPVWDAAEVLAWYEAKRAESRCNEPRD